MGEDTEGSGRSGVSMFKNRTEAGRRLAPLLEEYRDERPLVLGLPRGGVPVAAEVAQALGASLDVLVAQKIGAPGHEEYAIGAIAESGAEVRDEIALAQSGVTEHGWEVQRAKAAQKLEEYVEKFHQGRRLPPMQGRTVVLVDDGLATGRSALAALRALKSMGAEKIVLAVPVSSVAGKNRIEGEGQAQVVALEVPDGFYAIGQFYADFHPVSSDKVEELLSRFRTPED